MTNTYILQSWIVYLSMLFCCPALFFFVKKTVPRDEVLPEKTYSKGNKIAFVFISLVCIVVYTFFMGCRYGAGGDFFAYMNSIQNHFFSNSNEYAFAWLCDFIAERNLHFSVLFFTMAFIQITFLILAFRNYPDTIPFVIYSLFASNVVFSWQNGLRQATAMAMFIFALSCLDKKKIIVPLGTIFIATTFHKSAYMLYPVYFLFLFLKPVFNNVTLQVVSFAAAFIIGQFGVTSALLQWARPIAVRMGYDDYFFGNTIKHHAELLGLGYFGAIVLNLILICCSDFCKKYFQKTFVNTVFDLYYVGVIVHYLVSGNMMFDRINSYFYDLQFVFSGFVMAALFGSMRETKNPSVRGNLLLVGLSIVFLFFVFFIGYMIKLEERSSVYMFFWQA